MAKVILICGQICSGKSYYAARLKEKENAVILSTDELTFDLIHNEQGEFYNAFAAKANKYLRKKAAEIAGAGCNVILDWGFWTKAERKETTDYFNHRGIAVQWHYIDIEPNLWKTLIDARNKEIEAGNGGCNFYLDGGLMAKLLSVFEKPAKDEMDVWYVNNELPAPKRKNKKKADLNLQKH